MSQSLEEIDQQNIANNNSASNNSVEEGRASDYSSLQTGEPKSKLKSIEKYVLFISHASRGKSGTLPSEKPFVEQLEKEFNNSNIGVYVDFKEYSYPLPTRINKALKTSRYGLLVCSPRYLQRIDEDYSYISSEYNYFKTREVNLRNPQIIPLLFGVTQAEFQTTGIPLSSGSQVIEAPDSLLVSIDVESIKIIIQKVIEIVKQFDNILANCP